MWVAGPPCTRRTTDPGRKKREREENLPLSFVFARSTAKQRQPVPSAPAFSPYAPLLSFSGPSTWPSVLAAPLPSDCVPPRKQFACLSAPFFPLIWPTARAGPLRSYAAPRQTSSAAVVSCGPCVRRARVFQNDYAQPNLATPKSHYPNVPLRAPRDFFPAVIRSMPETNLP